MIVGQVDNLRPIANRPARRLAGAHFRSRARCHHRLTSQFNWQLGPLLALLWMRACLARRCPQPLDPISA
jgi:hypothetical protein